MICPRNQFHFFLLILFCNGCHSWFGGSKKYSGDGIAMDIEIKNQLPISKVTIGSNPNPYELMLGTFLPEIWILSKSACDQITDQNDVACMMCDSVNKYDDTSLTDDKKQDLHDIPYLNGRLKGYFIEETITIGSQTLKQKILIVTEWPGEFSTKNAEDQFDGYFGLMYLQSEEKNVLFKTLLESGKIKNQNFGLYLDYSRSNGELVLGGINEKYIDGGLAALKEVPLAEDLKGWLIKIDSITVGTEEVATNLKAYVDLSSTGFYGKRQVIEKINEALGTLPLLHPGDDIMVIPKCKPKEIVMKINGNDFTLEAEATRAVIHRTCISSFFIEDLEDYDLKLSIRFLNKVYSVFDVEHKKIKFSLTERKKKSTSNKDETKSGNSGDGIKKEDTKSKKAEDSKNAGE